MAKMNLDDMLIAAGVNVTAAKQEIVRLDANFGGEAGDIPEGALEPWANQFFDGVKLRRFLILVAKAWEADHAATLPEDRKWERQPGATKVGK